MGYTPPHLMSINDLFVNYDITKLKGKGNIKRKYKCADKKALLKKIFLRYLYLLISDMIEGGKVFVVPSKAFAEIRMRRIPHEEFAAARKAGAYRDVDILASEQKCYELVFTYKFKGGFHEKPIKLSHNFREKIVEKINTGYRYC